jgi:hypothetical protein
MEGFARIPPGQCNHHGPLNAPIGVRQDRLGHEKAETILGYTHAIGGVIEELPTKSARFFAPTLPKWPEVEAPKQLPVQ